MSNQAIYDVPGAYYGEVILNPRTLAKKAASAAVWNEILDFHSQLATDDYTRYLDGFYRTSLERFGPDWVYYDIVNVVYAAAKLVQPRRYLEIGVRRGRTLCSAVRGCPSVDIWACDMWVANYAGMDNPGETFVSQELAAHGHQGKCHFMYGNSHVLLPALLQAEPELRFDLITVDGDHSSDGAYADLKTVLPRLNPGGVVVFDDIAHPEHPFLRCVWEKAIAEDGGLASFAYDELGYGVAFAVRRS